MSDSASDDEDRLTFQHAAHLLRDELEPVLAEGYGDVWLDWSEDAGRMHVGVTTRCDPSAIAAAEQLIEQSGIRSRVDLVQVIWSARELTEGKDRFVTSLHSSVGSVSLISANAKLNSVVVWATSSLNQADLDALTVAIQAAAVSVTVLVKDVRWGAVAENEHVNAENTGPVVLRIQQHEQVDDDGLLLHFELANRAPTAVRFGAEFALEHFTDSRWVAVNVGGTWPAVAHRIDPRQRRVGRCRLPADLPAGRYRLKKEVSIEIDGAKERGQRPFDEHLRLAAEFTID